MKKPFFARFLEAQELEDVQGGKCMTMKYPSDGDDSLTQKYPSDGDECMTMKWPSDGDDNGPIR